MYHLRPLLEKLQANIKHGSDLDITAKTKNEPKDNQTDSLCSKLTENLSLNDNEELRQPLDFLNNWNEPNYVSEESLSDEDCEIFQNLKEDSFLNSKKNSIDNLNSIIKETESTSQNSINSSKRRKKSIVSMIHECAFQLRMNVEFEVIFLLLDLNNYKLCLQMLMEEGEPHNRQFTVRCRLTSPKTSKVIEADGRGSSKKAAKQNVCQIIYEKVKEIGKSYKKITIENIEF